jgi:uncharacterized protein with NRDE domain
MADDRGVWMGVKRCGCVAAVARDSHSHPGHTDESKLEMLRNGLSVVYASREEWMEKHRVAPELPLLADAVDPSAADPGKPSTRV